MDRDLVNWLLRESLDTKQQLIDECPKECERYNPTDEQRNNYSGLKCRCLDIGGLGHLEFALLYVLRNSPEDDSEVDQIMDKIIKYYSKIIDKYDAKRQD